MTNSISPVIHRYVSALLGAVGKSSAARATLSTTIHDFTKIIVGSADLQHLLQSPVISVNDQSRAVSAILDRAGFDKIFVGFVRVVIQKRRAAMLPDILAAVRAEIDKQDGMLDVYVDVAVPMTGREEKQLIDTVARATGAKPRLKTRVANDVIAGMRVRYNDVMIDDTVSSKLARLKQMLRG